MNLSSFLKVFLLFELILCNNFSLFAQKIPIQNYSINSNGQAQIEVNSDNQHYYILKIDPKLGAGVEIPASMTIGRDISTTFVDPLGQYPLEHYSVFEYPIEAAIDIDADGEDDISEYYKLPEQSPINAAAPININDGIVHLDSFSTFKKLSVTKDLVQWSEFLNGKGFVKYIIVDFHTASPKVYFINSNMHVLHKDFANKIGIDYLGDHIKKGQIIYHPTSISNNGTLGAFAFNYSNGHGEDFEIVQRTHELLGANMPFLENDLSYFITELNEDEYEIDFDLYQNSRVPILLEADVYAEVDYWGLNQTEGFGFFRHLTLDEIPGPKDIVLYETLPNALPRVGGIMTSVIQTPLSHVNLRAIQNKIPNAFIRDPLSIDSIASLVDHYIYFKVEQDNYHIREASLKEVNDWFENIRPLAEQNPPLNLEHTSILPLDHLKFEMFDGYGAKAANVATMRTFGFPEGTIPNGFAVPFYFYQEFMRYNDLFKEVKSIIDKLDINADREMRNDILKEFRNKIKEADMPSWMLDELATMHASYPEGTSIRCRSSSNNEDLSGFNGAGLYTSKTQHPDEGHISKSIKQVYASLWNLRAFEERDFYRVNHLTTSMGVLCHPNYKDEKANGVGVSTDPIYNTENTFYLNTQIGEELITNPEGTAIPEEILLDRVSVSENDYIIIQRSNLATNDETILSEHYLNQMRDYLTIIHDEFEILYDASNNELFAMDIEYKITKNDQLIIKQARPWVSYVLQDIDIPIEENNLVVFPNPTLHDLRVLCNNCNLTKLSITDSMGRQVLTTSLNLTEDLDKVIPTSNLSAGIYFITVIGENKNIYYTAKIIKN